MNLAKKGLGDLVGEVVDMTVEHKINLMYLGGKHDRHSQKVLAGMKENYVHEMAVYKVELDRREAAYQNRCADERAVR